MNEPIRGKRRVGLLAGGTVWITVVMCPAPWLGPVLTMFVVIGLYGLLRTLIGLGAEHAFRARRAAAPTG